MRVMVIVKASKESEAGQLPSEAMLTAMGKFNEELANAGVMLAGDGLQPSSKGKRVRIASDNSRSVIDGPFTETKELVAGFWIWQVKSMEEALAWVKRVPSPSPQEPECEIEVRPIFSPEDFGENFTPQLKEQEARIAAKMPQQKS